jgi:hypothetical protein
MKTKYFFLALLLVQFIAFSQNINYKINTTFPSSKHYTTFDYKARLDAINAIIAKKQLLSGTAAYTTTNLNAIISEIETQVPAPPQETVYDAFLQFYTTEIAKIDVAINEHIRLMLAAGITKPVLDDHNARINELESERSKLQAKMNDLIDIEQFKKKNFHFFSFGPQNANAYFNIMYSEGSYKIKALNSTGIALGTNTGSIFSELVSGNIKVVRFSLGTMITNSNTDPAEQKKDEAFQRLITSGGNTVLNAEYPLIYWGNSNNQFNFLTRILGKATADYPAFGTETDSFAGSASLAIDMYADGATANNDLRFYFNLNYGRIFGSDEFQKNLETERRTFNFGRLTGGVIVGQKVNLSVMFRTFSTEKNLDTGKVVIGGSIIL